LQRSCKLCSTHEMILDKASSRRLRREPTESKLRPPATFVAAPFTLCSKSTFVQVPPDFSRKSRDGDVSRQSAHTHKRLHVPTRTDKVREKEREKEREREDVSIDFRSLEAQQTRTDRLVIRWAFVTVRLVLDPFANRLCCTARQQLL
jgi:hypothetical protein